MKFIETDLPGVWIIEPLRRGDSRGYFCETYRADLFEAATGQRPDFVQDNESESVRGVLRGLHWQAGEHAQAKLVRVVLGTIVDVAVDLREDSPTFGRHIMVELSAENGRQLYIPRGFAHGFTVLSERAKFLYKTDNYYCPEAERSVRFDDPVLNIQWPVPESGRILSPKDSAAPFFADIFPDKADIFPDK